MLTHPFLSVLPGRRLRVIVPLLLLTMVAALAQLAAQSPLESVVTPNGLVSLMLAGDSETAHWIVTTWRMAGVLPMAFFAAGLSLLWFTVVSTMLSFGCVWAAQKFPDRRWLNAGLGIAW